MPPLRPQILLQITIIAAALLALCASSHNLHYSNRFLDLKELDDDLKELEDDPNTSDDNNTTTVISDSYTSPHHRHHIHRHRRRHIHHLPSREFLIAHNKVRVGFGEPPLVWDKTLARYARRWAAKRVFDCKMIHSYGPYGENIFWGGQDHWSPTDVVRSWTDEFKFYNSLSNNCESGQMCGHYTQIVWRETSRLGCARVRCLSGGIFVVCNYDPPGNFVDESPFSGGGGSNVVDPILPQMSGEANAQQPADETQTVSVSGTLGIGTTGA